MKQRDYKFAAKIRDIIQRITESELDNLRPQDVLATVQSIKTTTAYVLYAGEVTAVPVRVGVIQPQVGAVVLVSGPRNARYISNILSGNFTSTTGPPTQNGPDGSARLSHGYRISVRPLNPNGFFTPAKTSLSFNAFGTTVTWNLGFNPNNDTSGIPGALRVPSGTTGARSGGFVATFPSGVEFFSPGAGKGFLTVFRFSNGGTTNPPFPPGATVRWFVGLVDTNITGAPPLTTQTYMLGIGQEAGDIRPSFIHTNTSLSVVKTLTNMPAVGSVGAVPSFAQQRIVELRLYSDPAGIGNIILSVEMFAAGVSTYFESLDLGLDFAQAPTGRWRPIFWNANATNTSLFPRMVAHGFYHEFQPII